MSDKPKLAGMPKAESDGIGEIIGVSRAPYPGRLNVDTESTPTEVLTATAPAGLTNVPPEFLLAFAKSNADWQQLDRLIASIGGKKNLASFYGAGNHVSLNEKTGKFKLVYAEVKA